MRFATTCFTRVSFCRHAHNTLHESTRKTDSHTQYVRAFAGESRKTVSTASLLAACSTHTRRHTHNHSLESRNSGAHGQTRMNRRDALATNTSGDQRRAKHTHTNTRYGTRSSHWMRICIPLSRVRQREALHTFLELTFSTRVQPVHTVSCKLCSPSQL